MVQKICFTFLNFENQNFHSFFSNDLRWIRDLNHSCSNWWDLNLFGSKFFQFKSLIAQIFIARFVKVNTKGSYHLFGHKLKCLRWTCTLWLMYAIQMYLWLLTFKLQRTYAHFRCKFSTLSVPYYTVLSLF